MIGSGDTICFFVKRRIIYSFHCNPLIFAVDYRVRWSKNPIPKEKMIPIAKAGRYTNLFLGSLSVVFCYIWWGNEDVVWLSTFAAAINLLSAMQNRFSLKEGTDQWQISKYAEGKENEVIEWNKKSYKRAIAERK